MKYQPLAGFQPDLTPDLWCIFDDEHLYLSPEGLFWNKIPSFCSASSIVVGFLDNKAVGMIYESTAIAGIEKILLRQALQTYSTAIVALLSHGIQIPRAFQAHRFCGYCGSKCVPKKKEWCLCCTGCARYFYPRISPCIIVLIYKDNDVLLVLHQKRKRSHSFYTCIAGFIEPGESVEHAVKREAYEETGVLVANPTYITSQSWPFPNALMLGFHAEYISGDIVLEKEELSQGGWFHKNNLPKIPPSATISRQLIDIFVNAK